MQKQQTYSQATQQNTQANSVRREQCHTQCHKQHCDQHRKQHHKQHCVQHHKQRTFLIVAVVCVVLAALVFCAMDAMELFTTQAPQPDQQINSEPSNGILLRVGFLIFVCLITAIVEEVVFRGIFLRTLLKALSPTAAILITSFVFALLHAIPVGADVVGMDVTSADSALAVAIFVSLFLKFIQAFVFGIIMAGIVTRGGNLFIAIVVHMLFDVIYFAVAVISTGDFPVTYITSSPDQLIAVLFTIILMIPAVVLEFRTPTLLSLQ